VAEDSGQAGERGAGPLVVGLGNGLRGDDAAGLDAARVIRSRAPWLETIELEREPSALLELWPGRAQAIVIDAVAGVEPGRVFRFDGADPLPAEFGAGPSTHLLGLSEVIELGRELDRLPERLDVIGIEGSRFALGAPMTPAVRGAVHTVAAAVLAELGAGDRAAQGSTQ
jgi:hydrogenase maturation protease